MGKTSRTFFRTTVTFVTTTNYPRKPPYENLEEIFSELIANEEIKSFTTWEANVEKIPPEEVRAELRAMGIANFFEGESQESAVFLDVKPRAGTLRHQLRRMTLEQKLEVVLDLFDTAQGRVALERHLRKTKARVRQARTRSKKKASP